MNNIATVYPERMMYVLITAIFTFLLINNIFSTDNSIIPGSDSVIIDKPSVTPIISAANEMQSQVKSDANETTKIEAKETIKEPIRETIKEEINIVQIGEIVVKPNQVSTVQISIEDVNVDYKSNTESKINSVKFNIKNTGNRIIPNVKIYAYDEQSRIYYENLSRIEFTYDAGMENEAKTFIQDLSAQFIDFKKPKLIRLDLYDKINGKMIAKASKEIKLEAPLKQESLPLLSIDSYESVRTSTNAATLKTFTITIGSLPEDTNTQVKFYVYDELSPRAMQLNPIRTLEPQLIFAGKTKIMIIDANIPLANVKYPKTIKVQIYNNNGLDIATAIKEIKI